MIPLPVLLTLALLSATAPFATDMYLPALPAIGEEFGATQSAVQLTLTGFFLGMAAGQLVVGPISDVTGRKKLLLGGAVLALVASVIAAMAPTIGVLIVARVLQGLGGGTCVVLSRAVIPDLARGDQAAKAFSLLMAIQSIAPAAAPVMGGLLVGPIGWRGLFWTLAVLHVIQLVLAILIVPSTGGHRDGSSGMVSQVIGNYLAVLRTRRFWGFMVSAAFGFGAMFCYISASPFVLQDLYGLSATQYSMVFACNALGLMASSILNARLLDRFNATFMLRFGMTTALIAIAALFVAIMLSVPLPVILAILFFCVAPAGVVIGNSTALGTDLMRERAGSVSAVMGFFQFGLAGVVSPLMGLGDNAARTMAIGMITCILIAWIGMALATRWTLRTVR